MAKQHQTTIEINGLRYDARTGKPVTAASTGSVATVSPKPTQNHVSDVRRAHVNHAVHKTPDRSHTLMRHAVKKPTTNKLHASKPVQDVMGPAKKPFFRAPSALRTSQDAERLKRAQSVGRSNLVTKFNDVMQTPVTLQGISNLSGLTKPSRHPVHDTPVAKRVEPMAVQPHPISVSAPISAAPAIAVQLQSKAQSVLAQGLMNANSHLEKPVKPSKSKRAKRHGKFISVAAGSMAVLLLGSFFVLQNAPNLSMRYAAAKSGVHASLPGFHPAGFAVSKSIQYAPGVITVSFKSNSDDRGFNITQKASSWNSEALSSYVASNGVTPQTVEMNGRTIYLYGDSNATWVNGGVWYDITGASKLNSDQLIKIATSM